MIATVTGSEIGKTRNDKYQLVIHFAWGDSRASYYQGLEDHVGIEFAERALRALGWDPLAPEHNWDMERLHGERSELVGRKADIVLEEYEYGGKQRTRVKYVNSARELLSSDDFRALSARIRAASTGAEPAPF